MPAQVTATVAATRTRWSAIEQIVDVFERGDQGHSAGDGQPVDGGPRRRLRYECGAGRLGSDEGAGRQSSSRTTTWYRRRFRNNRVALSDVFANEMAEENTALGDLLGHVLGVLAEALERRLFCRGLVGIGETRSMSEPDLDEHGEGFDEEIAIAQTTLLVPLDPI
jgi:hypothetical protein